MPKSTKDAKIEETSKKKTTNKKNTTIGKTNNTNTKKTTKKSKSQEKNVEELTKPITKKGSEINISKSTKKTTTKTSSANKSSSSNTKKKTTTSRKSSNTKKVLNNFVVEYYDLPYRYNETTVRILYQTPTILFVYWDISDYDKENFIKQYGQNFFNNTKPILKIYNITKKYDFEVEINDFANSWYINVNDANCEYKVELGRKTINYVKNLNTEYIHIYTSNNIEFPNNKILLDQLPDIIKFKNIKNNEISTKEVKELNLIEINKLYNVKKFYNKFYKDEVNDNIITNFSSSSWN